MFVIMNKQNTVDTVCSNILPLGSVPWLGLFPEVKVATAVSGSVQFGGEVIICNIDL